MNRLPERGGKLRDERRKQKVREARRLGSGNLSRSQAQEPTVEFLEELQQGKVILIAPNVTDFPGMLVCPLGSVSSPAIKLAYDIAVIQTFHMWKVQQARGPGVFVLADTDYGTRLGMKLKFPNEELDRFCVFNWWSESDVRYVSGSMQVPSVKMLLEQAIGLIQTCFFKAVPVLWLGVPDLGISGWLKDNGNRHGNRHRQWFSSLLFTIMPDSSTLRPDRLSPDCFTERWNSTLQADL